LIAAPVGTNQRSLLNIKDINYVLTKDKKTIQRLNMKTYIVFVDKYVLSKRAFTGRIKTKRFEIKASNITDACASAINQNNGGDVSMFWPK